MAGRRPAGRAAAGWRESCPPRGHGFTSARGGGHTGPRTHALPRASLPRTRASRGRLPELGVLSPASQYHTERAEGSSVRAEGYCVRAGGVLRAHLRNISQIPAEGTRGRNGQLARHTSTSTGGAPRFIGRSVRGPTRGPPRGIRPAVSPLAPEGSKKYVTHFYRGPLLGGVEREREPYRGTSRSGFGGKSEIPPSYSGYTHR